MYMQELPETLFTTTKVKIKYDCDCKIEREMKWVDANKNYIKNNGKHICKKCWLKSDDNPAKKPEVQMKIAATIDERYGGVLPMNSQEAIESRKQQFEDPNFIEQRNQKRIKTSIERYGAEHHMKTEEGKNTQKEAMIAKYGVEHPLQSSAIVAKMLQTVQERHGVNNVMQIPEVMEKQQQSTLDAYGVKHYNQLPEAKEYLRENISEWLGESWENPWAKGIPKTDIQKEKARETIAGKIIAGTWHSENNSWKGEYKSKKCLNPEPMFRSSYELVTHIWLDEWDLVESYQYEPFFIPYYDTEGKKRYYFPDFIIKFKGKEILLILEIKNNYAMTRQLNISKNIFAEEFAAKNNMEYEMWLDEKISSLGINIENFKDKFIVHNK